MIENKRLKLVGEFIKKRRETLGISQRSLGLAFDPPVTTQFISNVERGVTPLPPMHIPVLAKTLTISEAELMALLEREYALKLNGRLGKTADLSMNSLAEGVVASQLPVAATDYDFISKLYAAYQGADPKTRQAFANVCEGILNLRAPK